MNRNPLWRLYLEEVTNSSFHKKLTCTSPYLLKEICDFLGVQISLEYLYTLSSTPSVGSHSYDIKRCIRLKPFDVSNHLYVFESDVEIHVTDFIYNDDATFKVMGVRHNLLNLIPLDDSSAFQGIYSLKRNEFFMSDFVTDLLSKFFVLVSDESYETQVRRIVDRLTPARCTWDTYYVNLTLSDTINSFEELSPFDYSISAVLSHQSTRPDTLFHPEDTVVPTLISIQFWEGASTFLHFWSRNSAYAKLNLSDRYIRIQNPIISGSHGCFVISMTEDYTESDLRQVTGYVEFVSNNHTQVSMGLPVVLKISASDATTIPMRFNDTLPTIYDMYDITLQGGYLCFSNISGTDNIISLTKTGSPAEKTLEVSTDKVTWSTWSELNSIRSYKLQAGGKVYIRGNNTTAYYTDDNNYYRFSSTGRFAASGSIMSLLDKTGQTTTLGDYALKQLFYNCTTLVTPPSISAVSVGREGMNQMFYGCTSLTTPPDLSNITEVGYYGMNQMFYGCTKLATPPDLSNITSVGDRGMQLMFRGCTALTTGPDLSKITSVGDYGMYAMFYGCTSLATPPDLSSITSVGAGGMRQMFDGCEITTPPVLSNITTVGFESMNGMFQYCEITTPPDLSKITSVGDYGMYCMFSYCKSLATPPDLSKITSVGNSGMRKMFDNCTSLETGPDLSKITSVGDYSMYQMFYGCSALTEAYAPTIEWDTSKASNWLSNVPASGTLYADSSIIDSIPTSNDSGCPSGWTKQSL